VSDKYMQSSGPLDRLTGVLKQAGIDHSLFVDTVPDPTSDVIEAGVARVKERDYDCLVALGGGSPMDTAKGIAILEAAAATSATTRCRSRPTARACR